MKDIVVILNSAHRQADRAALSLAVRALDGRVRALCTNEDAMRYALGAGVDAGWLLDEQDIVAATYDVAVMGSVSDLAAAGIAESRDAALIFDVLSATWGDDGDLRVTRDMGRGARDVLRVKGPVVIGMSDEAESAMYVSRYRRASVKRVPPQGRRIIDPGGAEWRPARQRTRTGDLAAKTAGSATSRSLSIFGVSDGAGDAANPVIQGDAATCAEHLVRYLAHHGFVTVRVAPPPAPREIVKPQAAREERAVVLAGVSDRIARGPRPIDGSARGLHRRPTPIGTNKTTSSPQIAGRLARGPRPVGQATPSRVRGPFSVGS